jgi:hypothetical protein
MVPITRRCLHHLRDKRLRVAKQQVQQMRDITTLSQAASSMGPGSRTLSIDLAQSD